MRVALMATIALAGCGRLGFDPVDRGDGAMAGPVWIDLDGPGGDRGRAIVADGMGNVYVTGWFEGAIDFGGGPLTSAGLHDAFVASYSYTGQYRWALRFGAAGEDDGRLLALTSDGGLVVVGTTTGTIDLGGGPLTSAGSDDMVMARLSTSTGGHEWSRIVGSTGLEGPRSIGIDASDDFYVSGYFTGTTDLGGGGVAAIGTEDVYVASYAANGAPRWARTFGTPAVSHRGRGVAADGAGNVIITGNYTAGLDLGGGPLAGTGGDWDTYVAKLTSATGQHVWSRGFPAGGTDWGFEVVVDPGGNAYVVGRVEGPIDFGGGALPVAGQSDLFVASFDPGGGHRWSRVFGGAMCDVASGAVFAAGQVFVSGEEDGGVDFGGGGVAALGGEDGFMAVYDPDGAYVSSRSLGSALHDHASAIAVDPVGGVWITGFRDPTNPTCGDPITNPTSIAFLARL